jgi:hypothetical protein
VRWAGLAIVLLLLASGCQSKPTAAGPAAAPGTGTLVGVVVSAAIAPLPGVVVHLAPGGLSNTTDAQGRFTFAGLQPGAYAITANRTGYRPAQAAAEVAAGPAGAPLKLVLEADATSSRFFEAYVSDGFVDESFNLAGARGNSGNTDQRILIGARPPDFVQTELVWDSTQQLGSDLDLTAIADDHNTTIPDFAQAEGPSPLLMKINSSVIQQYKFGPKVDLLFTVFSGQADEPVPGRGAGVVVQQRFRLISHAFYGFLPPDSWRFSVDGDPVPPA